jgi:hypothetical protein
VLEKYVLSLYFTTGTPNPTPSSINSSPSNISTRPFCSWAVSKQLGRQSKYNLAESLLEIDAVTGFCRLIGSEIGVVVV